MRKVLLLALTAACVVLAPAFVLAHETAPSSGPRPAATVAPVEPAEPLHLGYMMTGRACELCHSGHLAGFYDVAPDSVGPTDLLEGTPEQSQFAVDASGSLAPSVLLGRQDAACDFCHVRSNVGLGVYNRDPRTRDPHGPSTPYGGCTGCHSPHGDSVWGGAISGFALSKTAQASRIATDAPRNETGMLADSDIPRTFVLFCAECHPRYSKGAR